MIYRPIQRCNGLRTSAKTNKLLPDDDPPQRAPSTAGSVEVHPDLKGLYSLILLSKCVPCAGKFPYKARREIDQISSVGSSTDDKFRNFVSKLAFICWTDIKPSSIAACAVLHGERGAEYVITFNKRSPSELDLLECKIRTTLDMIARAPSTDDEKKKVLRHIISYCDLRVRGYLRALEKALGGCINACTGDNEEDGELALVSRPGIHIPFCGLCLPFGLIDEIRERLRSLQTATKEAMIPAQPGIEGMCTQLTCYFQTLCIR
jgi:hypothetical protein